MKLSLFIFIIFMMKNRVHSSVISHHFTLSCSVRKNQRATLDTNKLRFTSNLERSKIGNLGEKFVQDLVLVVLIKYLLGSLLLLLLLLGSIIFLFYWCFFNWCRFLSFGFFFYCNKQTDDILGFYHVVLIDLKLSENIVDLCFGHLVSPGFQCVFKHLGVNLSFSIVGFEGLNNQVVRVVAISSHLFSQHFNHVVA